MPTYEYRCAKCGIFEVSQRISDPPLKKCPTCKSKPERLISHSSFILKGSGWYATDYARKGAKPPESTPATDSGASNGTAKSESKPEAKSEPAAKSSPEKSTAGKSAD
jgi:putative FmdB family regulatory protein